MLIHRNKFARQNTPNVEILCVGLERLVVPQDLGCARCGHRCHEQRVPQAMLGNFGLQGSPIMSATLGGSAPKVKLQLSLARRRASICFIGPIALSKLAGCLASSIIDCLENVFIQLLCSIGLEWQAHHHECVSEALDTQTNRPVLHVRSAALLRWIVVAVDDLVEVACCNLGYIEEALEIIWCILVLSKRRQSNGRKVAHCDFVSRCILDDFCAEVGAMNGAKVLLVGLAVRCIFVEHVWRSCLHLRFQDAKPELLGLHCFPALALLFKFGVHLLEILTPDIHETFVGNLIVSFIGAKQCPLSILFYALHEEIWDPKGIEQVTCALFFLPVVLLHLKEIIHICMPWLKVHRKRTFALASTLVDVACGLVEVAKHRQEAIAVAICTTDVGSCGTDVGNRYADTTSTLRDQCTLLQGVIDAVDAVGLHCEQKARRHLWCWGPCVEECWRCMGEESPGHQIIGLYRSCNISAVNTTSDTHQHVLRTLNDLVMDTEKVGFLQCLEAKVVVAIIASVVNRLVQLCCFRLDEVPHIFGNQRCITALLVDVLEKCAACVGEGSRCALVKIRNGNTCSQC